MPIHDELIIALRDISEDIAEKIGSALKHLEGVELNSYPLRDNVLPPAVAAADSSYQIKKYSMAFVYAVQASAINIAPRGSSASPLIDADSGYLIVSPEHESVPRAEDARAISLDSVVKRTVKSIARWLEVILLSRASENAEVALFDGSLISFLWYSERVPDLRVQSFKGKRDKEWPSSHREMWRRAVKRMLKMRASNIVPIFIAKSIRRNYYASRILGKLSGPEASKRTTEGYALNDIILINVLRRLGKLPRKPFMLEPIYIESSGELPKPLAKLRDKGLLPGSVLPITVTYVVFGPMSQPYQVTTFGKLSAEELVKLLSSVYTYSRTGYPEPLSIAHNLCRIGKRELEPLLIKLGLYQLPTGREPLGEFL